MQNIVEALGDVFSIPIINDDRQVWFLRTDGGDYYNDFRSNGFVAIGWDNIPATVIKSQMKEDDIKEQISSFYPESKRPGLILGQLDSFYNRMKANDWIVIPSEGTQRITIGILGDIIDTEDAFKRNVTDDITLCQFSHRREVVWKDEIPSNYDVYLHKSLRAQQTISNITDIAALVFRHMYPAYITDDAVHITFQKTTDAELGAKANIELLSSVIAITGNVADLYGVSKCDDDIKLKTAVGSPGVIEVILPLLSGAPIVVSAILGKILLGKFNGKTGDASGLAAIFDMVNTALNDHKERQLKEAEITVKKTEGEKTKSEIRVKIAEADKIAAETEKLRLEAEILRNQQIDYVTQRNGQMVIKKELALEEMAIPDVDDINDCIRIVFEECKKCEDAIEKSGIQAGRNLR